MVFFLATMVACYLAITVIMFFMQDSMVFPAPVVELPEPLPGNAVSLEMTTSDGEILRHIRIPSIPGSPEILFFHGNGSSAYHELERAITLNQAGFAVTLAVGIVTSMFTAIMVTRAIVNLMYGGQYPKKIQRNQI